MASVSGLGCHVHQEQGKVRRAAHVVPTCGISRMSHTHAHAHAYSSVCSVRGLPHACVSPLCGSVGVESTCVLRCAVGSECLCTGHLGTGCAQHAISSREGAGAGSHTMGLRRDAGWGAPCFACSSGLPSALPPCPGSNPDPGTKNPSLVPSSLPVPDEFPSSFQPAFLSGPGPHPAADLPQESCSGWEQGQCVGRGQRHPEPTFVPYPALRKAKGLGPQARQAGGWAV